MLSKHLVVSLAAVQMPIAIAAAVLAPVMQPTAGK